MLSFEAPIILQPDGVFLYPDHQKDPVSNEPVRWYYMPMSPRFSLDHEGNQQVKLIKYVSESDAFALLNFDVNAGIDPEKLPAYVAQLQLLAELKNKPTLTPAQPISGEVNVILLGQQSGKEGSSDLVKGIRYPSAPSLYNDNRAIFSILLSPAGSDLVESTLRSKSEQDMTAIGIIYSLTFEGLRPSYAIKANVNLSKVETHLKKQLSSNMIFFGTNISNEINNINDKDAIDIQVDDMLPDEDKESAIKSMLAQVKTLIFDNLFKPAPEPKQPDKPTFWDRLLDQGARASRASMTMGLSELGSFQWNDEKRTDTNNRTLTIDMRERSITQFKLYPQAHLTRMLGNVDGPSLISELNATTGSDFFKKRTLSIDTNVNLTQEAISSLVVDLDYGGNQKSLLFTASQAPSQAQATFWNSLLDNNKKMIRPVQATFTINFSPRQDSTWPNTLRSTPQPISGDYWTVNPRTLYSVNKTRFIFSPSFDWDRYPLVTLYVRYRDDVNGVQNSQIFSINKSTTNEDQSNGVTWSFLQRDPNLKTYEYRVVYQVAGGNVTQPGDWISSDLPLVILDPPKKDIWIRPPAKEQWPSDLQLISVQIFYDDPANNLHLRPDLVQFFAGSDPKKVRILLADADKQTYSYQVTLYGNKTITLPTSKSSDDIIRVFPGMKAHNIALLSVDPALFQEKNISKISLQLSHHEAGLDDTTAQVTFTPTNTQAQFSYDFLQSADYLCKVTYSFTNDDPFTKRFTVKNGDNFIVPTPQP